MFTLSTTLRYTLIVSLGGFIFGFDASVISGTLTFITRDFSLGPWEQGLVTSAPTLGAIIATVSAGAICDAVGRKRVLIGIAALYLVSAIASAFATGFGMLVVARFMGGLAFCSLMIAPMYIAEISAAKHRGKLVSMNQLNIMLGFSAAYFANYYVLQLSQSEANWVNQLALDTHTWRWMLGLEILPAAAYLLMLFSIDESPRWLLLQHRQEEGRAVMNKLFSLHEQQRQWAEIKHTLAEKPERLTVRLRFLFGPAMRFALLVGMIVGIAQQITGINAVYFYAPGIFEQSGVGTNAAFMQAIWIGVINVVFTLLAMGLIDRLGRRPLLIIGLCGVFLSMLLCAYGFQQATYTLSEASIASLGTDIDKVALQPLAGVTFDSDVAYKQALAAALGENTVMANQGALIQAAALLDARLVLAGILGFVASFAFSLGPVMWVLFSEIFPNRIRGLAISTVGVVNSLFSFSVTLVFPWELANLGSAMTFLLYGIFALVGLLLVMWLLPETKAKSLEQLESLFVRPDQNNLDSKTTPQQSVQA